MLEHGIGFGDSALLAVRFSVGGFFAISGYHKLFNATRRESLHETFVSDGVADIPLMMRVIPLGELLGGLGVAFGALTVLAASGLIALCGGALVMDGLRRIGAMKPLDAADWCDDVLYLPETLYIVCLLTLVSFGPGALSLDALI